MKKILFPTDFSETSDNAFVYALKLAEAINAEIITLHVYELPQVDYINVPVYLLDIYEVTEWSNFENYRHHVPRFHQIAERNKLDHITISNVLESGNLLDSIRKISETEPIDFIVMGTNATEDLLTSFLGSVTNKVMNHSDSVVLAIPEGCHFTKIKHLLFATKYLPKDRALLDKVIEFAKLTEAKIDCLHIVYSDQMDQRIIDEWKQGITYENIAFQSIASKDVEGEILDFIDKNGIDMLAIPKHHRGFLEGLFHASLTKKLTFHLQIPILTLHD